MAALLEDSSEDESPIDRTVIEREHERREGQVFVPGDDILLRTTGREESKDEDEEGKEEEKSEEEESDDDEELDDDEDSQQLFGFTLPDMADAGSVCKFLVVVDADSLSLTAGTAAALVKTYPMATSTMCFLTSRVRSTSSSRFCFRTGLCGIRSSVLGTRLKNIPLHFVPNITLMTFHRGPFHLHCNFFYLGRRNLNKRSFFTAKEHLVINICLNIAKYHIEKLVTKSEFEVFGLSSETEMQDLIDRYDLVMLTAPVIETAPSSAKVTQTEMGVGIGQLLLVGFERDL